MQIYKIVSQFFYGKYKNSFLEHDFRIAVRSMISKFISYTFFELFFLSVLFLYSPSSYSLQTFEAPTPNDIAKNLVDEWKYETLDELKIAGLEESQLHAQPWSGWYWPLNQGGLAYRYADPNFPLSNEWNQIHDYFLNHIGNSTIDHLSPAEKYDLLLNDHNFSLTRAMLRTADDHSVNGTVEAWMGFCGGWANASMMMPRPSHSITVTGADGVTRIEFRPSDIKALGTLLWSNGIAPARVVGTICEESPVSRDSSTARPLHTHCRDTNPATFHLAITHQIGLSHRSLLMDSDSGYQVWNQPISNYSYSYFNPLTGQAASLENARILRDDYLNDPYKNFRTPQTHFIIGIETQVTFIYENRPSLLLTDSPEYDEKRFPVYKYDLELDSSGRIIGGEWYSRLHPDVLWVTPLNTVPTTQGDPLVLPDEKWNPELALPPSWQKAARVSVDKMQPLPAIVNQLFEWSKD